MLLLSFSASLVFSTLHHLAEEHHHQEECSASDRGETHLHGWEFEECHLCDLQFTGNYLGATAPQFASIRVIDTPYDSFYTAAFTSAYHAHFTSRGPPEA